MDRDSCFVVHGPVHAGARARPCARYTGFSRHVTRGATIVVMTPPSPRPSADAIRLVLAAHDGNVTAAARELGVHRTTLHRWVAAIEGGDEPTQTPVAYSPELERRAIQAARHKLMPAAVDAVHKA